MATVHYKTAKWLPIQQYYLDRHMKEEYRIYACTPPPARKYRDRVYFASDYEPGVRRSSHPMKLNFLAGEILKEADDGDLLMFIDGDAFPIADFLPFIREKLADYPLVAVRRDENNGDIQPHPSFCMTTAGFWREIEGDWNKGYEWKNNLGEIVSDVGGNLFEKLEKRGCKWYPLVRTNTVNLHPLWFAIYGNIVYHHGAGFRKPESRIDRARMNQEDTERFKYLPSIARKGIKFLKAKAGIQGYKDTPEYKENLRLMNRVFKSIQNDHEFYRIFME